MRSMRFHEKIVKLCADRDWDQADLWRAVDKRVSRTTVSNWFNGVSRPDMDTSLSIARALGISLDFLADDALDAPPASPLSEEEKKILWMVHTIGTEEAVKRLALVKSEPPPVSEHPARGPRRPGSLREFTGGDDAEVARENRAAAEKRRAALDATRKKKAENH